MVKESIRKGGMLLFSKVRVSVRQGALLEHKNGNADVCLGQERKINLLQRETQPCCMSANISRLTSRPVKAESSGIRAVGFYSS